jgi:hypothetical protein
MNVPEKSEEIAERDARTCALANGTGGGGSQPDRPYWMDDAYWRREKHPYGDTEAVESEYPLIEEIVAEAERRGRVEAWLDAVKIVEKDQCLQHMCRDTWDECECQTQAVVMGILTKMYEKIKAVSKKPVTDEGK